jgi:hypothetical protein
VCGQLGIQRKEKMDLKNWKRNGCSKPPQFCLCTDAKKYLKLVIITKKSICAEIS